MKKKKKRSWRKGKKEIVNVPSRGHRWWWHRRKEPILMVGTKRSLPGIRERANGSANTLSESLMVAIRVRREIVYVRGPCWTVSRDKFVAFRRFQSCFHLSVGKFFRWGHRYRPQISLNTTKRPHFLSNLHCVWLQRYLYE